MPASKLRPPSARAGVLPRPRLEAALDSARGSCRTSVLSAPAGYGKTTAVAAWARRRPGEVAWLSLDVTDGSEAAIPALLHAALRAIDALPDAPPTAHVTELLTSVEAASWRGVLVVDDAHVLDADAAAALATWVERTPEGIHTVVLTRTASHLPLARWLVRGVAEVFEADRLRLELVETRALLADTLPDLPPELAERLHRQIEGWAAGVHLAARTLVGRRDPADHIERFTGTDRYVLAFLTEEVLLRLPDDLHDAALLLALEPRLCAGLVTALTGRRDGGAVLERLEAREAFLERLDVSDDAGPWFRFPGFFRDLLVHRLRALRPDVVPALEARSRAWWAQRAAAPAAAGDRAAGDGGAGDGGANVVGDPTAAEELTPREREVLRLLAAGGTTKAMARALGRSPNTIKTHTKRLFEKLGVRTRAEAAARAVALGLAAPVDPPARPPPSHAPGSSPATVTRRRHPNG